MARDVIRRHGRTHRDGGTDPIGGRDRGEQVSPFQPLNVLLSNQLGFSDGWDGLTIDTTLFGDGYRYVDDTPAVGKWVAFPCMMGPTGSTWATTLVYRAGSDYGQIHVEYATSSQDGLPGATGNEGPGFMQEPFDVTFVRPTVSPNLDAYNSTPLSDLVSQRTALFRIGGDPGDELTAFGVDPVSGEPLGDGGPGLYWIRLYVSGKNASSSNYKWDVQYLAAERVPGG